MRKFLLWLVTSYRGSNRVSFWLRKKIEQSPVKQIVGVHPAGLAFFSAVIVPGADDVFSTIEVIKETQQTYVEVVPTHDAFRWPMNRFSISQQFSIVHPGMDLTAPLGTPVFPVADGWAAWANASAWGYGKHLLIEHDKGVTSLYAHLSEMSVRPGETVTKETKLGRVGSTGWSTGSHVHLEIYQDGIPVNPIEVLPDLTLGGK